MTKYTINMQNKTSNSNSYVVFMDPPTVSVDGRNLFVLGNAWATSPNISNQSSGSVTASQQYSIDWWTPQTSPAVGGQIGSGGHAASELGQPVAVGVAAPSATPFSGVIAVGSDPVASDATAPPGPVVTIAKQD